MIDGDTKELFWRLTQLKDLSLLDRCLKETLRLRPPIMTMMRMTKTPQVLETVNQTRLGY